MRPTFFPEAIVSNVESHKKGRSMAQAWHQNGRCPEETIPIRRTKMDDVLRASSVKRYGKKKHRTVPMSLFIDPDLINESGHQVWLNTKKPTKDFE